MKAVLRAMPLLGLAGCWPYLPGPVPGEDGIWPDDTGVPVDTAETDDTVDTSDTVDSSDTVDTSDTVDSSDTSDTSDTVDSSDTVDTSDTSDTSDTAMGDLPDDYETWFGRIAPSQVRFSNPYTHDAGIDDVRAAAPPTGQPELTGLSLRVTGAIVINLGGPPEKNVWLQDRNGAIRTFGTNADPAWFAGVQVGDAVSFTVTELVTYRGEPEITGITGLVVESSGNPIYVREGTGRVLDYNAHGMQNVRLYGELTALNGPCGSGYTCFEFTHGDYTMEARMRDTVGAQVGSKVHFVGPLMVFDANLRAPTDTVEWYHLH